MRPARDRASGLALALALGALVAVAVACGASAKSAQTGGMPPTMAPGSAAGGGARAQITQLDDEITSELGKLNIPVPPPPGPEPVARVAASVPAPKDDPTCKPAENDSCKTSCTLANSICDNAKKICDIAAGMNNDAWANGKCSTGNTSCERAHARCCACQL